MTESTTVSNIDSSESSLYEILKNCANLQSYESLPYYDEVSASNICPYYSNMISANMYAASGNVSSSSYTSDDSFSDNIIENDGRISLAYENLRTIPRRIAENFATQTKFLDLSYNNFQNLSFLTFFEELHTLILDRNTQLDVNTLPYLPNLNILWLNNCDISNITDWVNRIRAQCPNLRQLSIMGNPGLGQTFAYSRQEPSTSTTIHMVGDYREYILQVLPNLHYLDSSPCQVMLARDSNGVTKTCGNEAKAPSFQSMGNGTVCSQPPHRVREGHKSSPTLIFKDIFSLKRRKKSTCQSSSTN